MPQVGVENIKVLIVKIMNYSVSSFFKKTGSAVCFQAQFTERQHLKVN